MTDQKTVVTNDHCTLGVGCDEYGVCYAAAHGQPEKCGRAASPSPPGDAATLRWLAGDDSGKFTEGDKAVMRRTADAIEALSAKLLHAEMEAKRLREALAIIETRTRNPVPTSMPDRAVLDWVNGQCRASLQDAKETKP